MGRWAQARKRGGGGINPGALPAIMLGVDDEGDFVWSPALPPGETVSALIQDGDTVDGPWNDHVTIDWTAQPWTIDESHRAWRLVGLDELANPTTLPSNVVDLL